MELLAATFIQMKDKRQLLLILITMYSGFEQAFLTGDFTKVCLDFGFLLKISARFKLSRCFTFQSFVTCPIAVNWVGFVLICFGACDAVFSFLFGRVEKYTGRLPLFGMASVINLALIITFLVSRIGLYGDCQSRSRSRLLLTVRTYVYFRRGRRCRVVLLHSS